MFSSAFFCKVWNDCSGQQHTDFLRAYGLSRSIYLGGDKSRIPELIRCLVDTMPAMQNEQTIASVLRDSKTNLLVQRILLNFNYISDRFELLQHLGGLFLDPDGMTYPARVLLLLTGYGPAPHGRMGGGLSALGLIDYAAEMPTCVQSKSMAFYRRNQQSMDAFVIVNRLAIDEGIKASVYARLYGAVGFPIPIGHIADIIVATATHQEVTSE